MLHKFIGKDGSMGLSHGEVYDIELRFDERYIWVSIVGDSDWNCPYTSVRAFNANWEGIFNSITNCNNMSETALNLDPRPVGGEELPKSQWIDGAFENSKRCPQCGKYATKIHQFDAPAFDYIYCPYCGKKNKEDI